MLRKDIITTNSFYHIFNRGVNKAKIFFDDADYSRFLEAAIHYKSSTRQFSHSKRYKYPDTGTGQNAKVQVFAYCLMPNHFHFLIRQLADHGITSYMQHLSNSYSHYIHTRYKRTGPLFEGRFKNRLIDSDEQLVHVSRYIHLNPLVSELVDNLINYKWSSYKSYITSYEDKLISDFNIVLGRFKSRKDYEQFVIDQSDYGKELERIKHLALDFD
ncbi:hypothetical protein A2W45_00020 [Candidatus Curtissbacteria bacterium RIFCSPHIGHO2_12_41_11]|uniref:Transposase IS200-like domain-containing protein n=3 Tax=Candidatus Curtissiibacteriota TaxID=1752717 RepID=A0A1F5G8Y8_9BACT|nr:MAG: hypothetical protein A3D04_03470 [Candidatus Curtissbacteria bacterium RIFCSPHIGHO2_02_FULL_40_16b]OGD99393.1 MAG: hypothetical protein A2W45_00020 [Candidatus Curtissbacteria bacterium RIFCSPHIGHO2_12_41_11]OGE00230.1 MAG: hypothetical protein A3J17_03765 [Candidatus Curtissbacteria bacterium RIFCSPLOWO2_02_FULL_40_11]OGE12953.1 MAG: hypothetical protein A3G14_02775 [Candidatus Curtissbacteria bacterium RIFCSPLOWO2_12_FULL_38_9]